MVSVVLDLVYLVITMKTINDINIEASTLNWQHDAIQTAVCWVG